MAKILPLRAGLRRLVPTRGPLTLACIRGPWRPSGTVEACGLFAVVWSARSGDFWAALHDFSPADQLRLIEACRWADDRAGGKGR